MQNKLLFNLILILLGVVVMAFAEEEITITTYYPSPYGSYNELQTNKMAIGDTNGDEELTSADQPANDGDLLVAGNVGIGTTAPGASLEVLSLATGPYFGPDTPAFYSKKDTGTNSMFDVTANKMKIANTSDNTQGPYTKKVLELTDNYTFTYPSSKTNIGLYVNMAGNAENQYAAIFNNGNVGIGTANPLGLLQVGISPSPGLLVTASGNVGIGTTSPSGRLHVKGAGTTTGKAFWVSDSDNTDRVVILDNGKVGIGMGGPVVTDMPAATLHIRKESSGMAKLILLQNPANNVGATTEIGWAFGDWTGIPLTACIHAINESSGYATSLSFKVHGFYAYGTAWKTPLHLKHNGRVGIETTDPGRIFEIKQGEGNARADGWDTWSSREFKKDITYLSQEDYAQILVKLENLKVARYHFKSEPKETKLRLGLIAEEAPSEIVDSDKKSTSLSDAIGFLMAAVKAQQKEIQTLRQEISRLKGDL